MWEVVYYREGRSPVELCHTYKHRFIWPVMLPPEVPLLCPVGDSTSTLSEKCMLKQMAIFWWQEELTFQLSKVYLEWCRSCMASQVNHVSNTTHFTNEKLFPIPFLLVWGPPERISFSEVLVSLWRGDFWLGSFKCYLNTIWVWVLSYNPSNVGSLHIGCNLLHIHIGICSEVLKIKAIQGSVKEFSKETV